MLHCIAIGVTIVVSNVISAGAIGAAGYALANNKKIRSKIMKDTLNSIVDFDIVDEQ